MNYDFTSDLSDGQYYEVSTINKLREVYKDRFEFHGFNCDGRYDALVSLDKKLMKLEIKTDFIAKTTGNIAIEYRSRGKDSGILTTESDIFIYNVVHKKDDFTSYIFNTKKLKSLVHNKEYTSDITGGDYGSGTKMYLFKIDDIIHYAKIL